MPIPESTANLYLQLGVAGGTLLILLVFVIMLFSSFNKLCGKIDALITSNALHTNKLNEVLLSNDKDQKATNKSLDKIIDTIADIQKRVVRIDDRTYKCLGNPNGN